MSRSFIDEVTLRVRGGRGGDGCTSFNRQPHQPHGGPDGGDGGDGGNVILRVDERLETLSHLPNDQTILAENGDSGGPNQKNGAVGDSTVLEVPRGTRVYDRSSGELMADLRETDQQFVVARGGSGGRGNRCFANSKRQLPRFHERGLPGELRKVRLELRLLADVGIIGAPNAGKSTLLRKLTNARPEVAQHPFTTTTPNLGVVEQDYQQRTLCDIPGLIENAHQGAGLGLEFLKHASRTSLLLHVVNLDAEDPTQEFLRVRAEIQAYSEDLADKPRLILLNKADLVDRDLVQLVKDELPENAGKILVISNQTGEGLKELRREIFNHFESLDNAGFSAEPEETVVTMESEEPLRVFEHEGSYLVQGDEVKSLLKRFDLTNPDAMSYVRDRLMNIGLHHRLEQAGCEPGDTVRVGQREFEYTG